MDKSKLLADRVTTNVGEHRIPDVGLVKFRALSRFEINEASRLHGEDPLKWEQYVLSRAMTDPVLTKDDVATWQKNSGGGEINEVALRINALSGLGKGADKSVVSDVPDES